MNFGKLVMKLCPRKLELPVRYYHSKARGNLEYELGILHRLIPKRGRGIDIGANVGFYSYRLSRICSVVEAL